MSNNFQPIIDKTMNGTKRIAFAGLDLATTIAFFGMYIGAGLILVNRIFSMPDNVTWATNSIFIPSGLVISFHLLFGSVYSTEETQRTFNDAVQGALIKVMLLPLLIVSISLLGKNKDASFLLMLTCAMIAYRWLFTLVAWIAAQFSDTSSKGMGKARSLQDDHQDARNEQETQRIKFVASRPEGNFASILGMDEVKARLYTSGQEIIKSSNEKTYPRNGILLTGKPGNGKTVLAEALAGELKLPFISVSYGDLASKWVNETTENVAKLFRDATQQAPCVLFIDEIDSLIRNRSGSSSEEGPQITNTILTEIVNIRKNGVVVIAATNFLDKLDPAAIREGRFDFKIEIPAPDLAARTGLIDRFAKKHGISIESDTRDIAAKRWEGFSVARINAVVEEAARACKNVNLKQARFTDLQIALRQVQGRKGSIPENTPCLDDLAMSADMREKLKGIALRMKNIEEVEKVGGSVPSGLLFYGPPGTGKTLIARSLAKESGWGFLNVQGADMLARTDKIDEVLAEASDIRPCIVFIDEADDILGNRRFSNASTITNKLLTAMDGSNGKVPDVVFIAATNHPDAIDSAAMRGGRFTEKIAFATPDIGVIEGYAKRWLETMKAKADVLLTPSAIAERLYGESIANIKEILQTSINIAIGHCNLGQEVPTVTVQDLVEAHEMVAGQAQDGA